ncbi:MAG: RsmG family class I SAM-dependent methyltransferase [Bdellovibrionota bacterium]
MDTQWRIRDHFPNLTDDLLSTLRLFHVELMRFNQTLSLISTFTEKNADLLHFYDIIKASEFIIKDNPTIKEVYNYSSGNGLTGIIFGILNPQIKINIVVEDQRKLEFVKHIIARAQLANVHILNLKPDNLSIAGPSVNITRDFSNLARTLLLGNKILAAGSMIYSLKGADWFKELTALPSQISSTWNNEMAFEYELPEALGPRVVIKSVKIA